MPSEVINFLNHFNLGTALELIIACVTCLSGAYLFYKREVKKIKNEASQETLEELEDEQEEETIDNIQKDLHKLEGYVNQKFKRCDELNEVEDSIRNYRKVIQELNDEVILLKKNVDTLMKSCITLNRVLITIQRNKIVNGDKIVDLNSLRDIEELYANYLEEVKDGGDEYMAKFLREIRDIPVKGE